MIFIVLFLITPALANFAFANEYYEISGFVSYINVQTQSDQCKCHLALETKDKYYSNGVHSASTCFICQVAMTAFNTKIPVTVRAVIKGYYVANDINEIAIGSDKSYWPEPTYGKYKNEIQNKADYKKNK